LPTPYLKANLKKISLTVPVAITEGLILNAGLALANKLDDSA
jgi:hypothetical protein